MNTSIVKDPVTLLWKVIRGSPLEFHVISVIHSSWGSNNSGYFPGPQPISIERVHFTILKNNEYVVCEKTDGVRHLLVSTLFGDKKVCVLVNRAFDMTVVPLNVPKASYQGTILDGELIDKTFIVHDAVCVSGVSVKHENLFKRIESAEAIVSGVLKVKSDPVTVKVKKFFNLKDYKAFITEHIPSVVYKIDGLVFTPVHECIKSGTHETMFKWKPRDGNTIDFQFKRWDNQSKWGMYVIEKGRLIFESELSYVKAPSWITEDCIVECQYMCDEHPRWWKPLNLRTDKTHPNNRRTFYNTLVNIREDIQIGEFDFEHKNKKRSSTKN
jgi:hypothetical protein